jgi:hypothetical protein
VTAGARSVFAASAPRRLRREHDAAEPELRTITIEEEPGEDADVRAPFAQWRDPDREDVQAVIQVRAKSALRDLVREIAVGRGQDADVHADRLVRADALHLAALKRAQ